MYGSLAKLSQLRKNPNFRTKCKEQQFTLLRNFDYLNDWMKKIKNQGNILQHSGYFRESIEHFNRKI